jgi:hypothetical protein
MDDETWRVHFIQALTELSNIEQQRQDWLSRSPPEGLCPTELVCSVFDDSAIDELMKIEVVFSPEADAVLKQMSKLTNTVDVEQPLQALLRDERWVRLTQLAGEAIRAIQRGTDREIH